jgi:hypothetical protein
MIFIYFLPRQDFPLFNENICWIRNVAKHRGIFHAIYKASCTSRSWIDRGENRWIAQKHWKGLCWKGIVENPTIDIKKMWNPLNVRSVSFFEEQFWFI